MTRIWSLSFSLPTWAGRSSTQAGSAPPAPPSLRGGRAHGRRGRRGPVAGRGGRAGARKTAAEPSGLAAVVVPPTRVRPALRPPPREPPAPVSGLGPARGAGQGVGPSPEALWARARARGVGGDARRRPRCPRRAPSAPLRGSACVCTSGAPAVSLGWTSAGGRARLQFICLSSVYRACHGVRVPTCLNVPE